MLYSKDEIAVITLDSIDGLEYKHKIKILGDNPQGLFDDSKIIFSELKDNLAKTVSLAFSGDYSGNIITELENKGVTAITYLSDNYPTRLKHLDCFPLVLYCKGNIDLLNCQQSISIVGSRKTLPQVNKFIESLSGVMSENGVVVVTGNANGGDLSAVNGSICSGNLISVIAGGFDHIYPDCNKNLCDKISETCLLISEQPPHIEPKPWIFPVRNRIIAGLGDKVLIASGEMTSGTRHTSAYALDYGKDLFAIPYSIGVASGELPNNLIKNGAYLCDSIEDVLSEYGITKNDNQVELSGEELEIYKFIKDGQGDMNKYCIESGKKFYEIAPILTSLELQGFIVKNGGIFKPVK